LGFDSFWVQFYYGREGDRVPSKQHREREEGAAILKQRGAQTGGTGNTGRKGGEATGKERECGRASPADDRKMK
jgi:hypothetical protein